MIFAKCSFRDLASLAFTTFDFTFMAETALWKATTSVFGKWIGKKLYCIGDFVDYSCDIPNLSESEWAEDRRVLMESWADEASSDKASSDYSYDDDDINLAMVASEQYKLAGFEAGDEVRFSGPSLHYASAIDTLAFWRQAIRGRSNREDLARKQSAQRGRLGMERSMFLPSDSSWVLLNHNTREFVRSEAIAMSLDLVNGPHITPIGFGHLILSKIYCGVGSGVSLTDQFALNADSFGFGREWAGHRFEIVPETSLMRWNRYAQDMIEDHVDGPRRWKNIGEWARNRINMVYEAPLKQYLKEHPECKCSWISVED